MAKGRGAAAGVFFISMMAAAVGILHAQVAAEMDALLETPAINFVQASRFVLAAADIFQADDSPSPSAFDLAREKGWLPKNVIPGSQVRLGELCFLVTRAFGIKGSFLYALFPGPRYAFRELDYLRMIPGRRDPARRVSGEDLLRILDMVTAGENMNWAAETPAAVVYPAESPALPEDAAVEETPVPEPAAAVYPAESPALPEDAAVEETPVPEPAAAVYPAESPALPEDAAAAAEEREQIAVVIRAELEEYNVADTSVRVEEEGIVISLNNIQFMPDSTELTAGEMAKLREIAAILSWYPGRNILVGGHTAMAGTSEGRLLISTERARAVADVLLALKVRQAEEIIVTGYGADRPLGDTATEAGQAMNRRVEIILLDRGRP